MRYKKENDFSYALGATLTYELMNARPELVECVYYNAQTSPELVQDLSNRCKALNIEISLNNKIFNLISAKENCYVAARFHKYYDTLKSGRPHIVLVNPSNTGNLGTIIRSAVGFSVRDIAVIAPGADCFDPKTVRASMGSLFQARIQYFGTIEDYLAQFPNYRCYPFMLHGATDLREVENVELSSAALIFGNEASGLDERYLNIGQSVVIRHSNRIDSLNLQTAVSLALYQFTRGVESFE